ncbi:MAG TPA: hypothetical protein VJT73_03640, partial [Polyangiaceae bacterium]|nr:hypothetical protein [Polyangiaceae bacterium]
MLPSDGGDMSSGDLVGAVQKEGGEVLSAGHPDQGVKCVRRDEAVMEVRFRKATRLASLEEVGESGRGEPRKRESSEVRLLMLASPVGSRRSARHASQRQLELATRSRVPFEHHLKLVVPG